MQANNKMMKTMVTKSHPSVGKEDPPKKKVIPKELKWSKKKRVDYYAGGSGQEGQITLFDGG